MVQVSKIVKRKKLAGALETIDLKRNKMLINFYIILNFSRF